MQNIEKQTETLLQQIKTLGELMGRMADAMDEKLAREYAAEQSPIDDLPTDYESATHGE